VVIVVILAAVIAFAALKPGVVKDSLLSVLGWTQRLSEHHRFASALVIIGCYVVACVLFLPGSLLTIGAGFVLKTLWGTATVSAGSTLGACAAFLVSRTVARRWIEKKLEGSARFAAIDRAVGREGFKIVLLTRLSPVFPFNLLNYGFGLTKVRFWHYALASWIGMLPGTVMYVYLGAALGSLAEAAGGKVGRSPATHLFFWLGLAVAVAVAVLVARVARRALKEAVSEGMPGKAQT
jgi:uncharacterized membrane protein YdjX (TVP38/TMEM64 family)